MRKMRKNKQEILPTFESLMKETDDLKNELNPVSLVAVRIPGDSKLGIHLPYTDGNYYTLCRLDGIDSNPLTAQEMIDVPPGTLVNCKECFNIWKFTRGFKRRHFALSATK